MITGVVKTIKAFFGLALSNFANDGRTTIAGKMPILILSHLS
jgi:hypothetical protein